MLKGGKFCQIGKNNYLNKIIFKSLSQSAVTSSSTTSTTSAVCLICSIRLCFLGYAAAPGIKYQI